MFSEVSIKAVADAFMDAQRSAEAEESRLETLHMERENYREAEIHARRIHMLNQCTDRFYKAWKLVGGR